MFYRSTPDANTFFFYIANDLSTLHFSERVLYRPRERRCHGLPFCASCNLLLLLVDIV